jgi:hypothetical protein
LARITTLYYLRKKAETSQDISHLYVPFQSFLLGIFFPKKIISNFLISAEIDLALFCLRTISALVVGPIGKSSVHQYYGFFLKKSAKAISGFSPKTRRVEEV